MVELVAHTKRNTTACGHVGRSHFDRCRCPLHAVLLLRYIETFCIGLKSTGNNVHDAVQRCRAAARPRQHDERRRCSGMIRSSAHEPRQRNCRSRAAAISCGSNGCGCRSGISKKGGRQGGTTSCPSVHPHPFLIISLCSGDTPRRSSSINKSSRS